MCLAVLLSSLLFFGTGPRAAVPCSTISWGAQSLSIEQSRLAFTKPIDLSRPGPVAMPAQLLFHSPVPLLSRNQVLPAGDHPLSVYVFGGGRVGLRFGDGERRGDSAIWIAEAGEFDQPIAGVEALLSALETGEERVGRLRIRWLSMLLEVPFRDVRVRSQELGSWTLDAYELPGLSGSHGPSTLLGTLRGPALGDQRYSVVLSVTGTRPRLHLENPAITRLLVYGRELDDKSGGGVAASGKPGDKSDGRREAVAARLRELRLTQPDLHLLGSEITSATATQDLVTLEQRGGGEFCLVVAVASRLWRFHLASDSAK